MPSPYPYQERGREWLKLKNRRYLGDQMRLGKSVQSIIAAEDLGAQRILVLAPAVAVPNWRVEFPKWWKGKFPKVQVLSYSRAINLPTLGKADLVICDEAHYLKTPSAERTKTAFKAAKTADRAWLLSGTPMPNHPGELWAPVKALWPELRPDGMTRYDQWVEFTCKTRPTVYGPRPYAIREESRPYLRKLLQKIMLRRKVKDVEIELPPVRTDVFQLPPEGIDLTEYEDYEIEEETYTSTLRRLLGEAKAGGVAHIIGNELLEDQYEKIVILYWHRSVRDTIKARLEGAGIHTLTIGGEHSQKEKWERAQLFNNGPFRVLLAQQKSVGVGISLASASEMALVEPAWSPDDNFQVLARMQHIGKQAKCRARIFTVPGTLDSAVMGTIAQKMGMQEELNLKGGV